MGRLLRPALLGALAVALAVALTAAATFVLGGGGGAAPERAATRPAVPGSALARAGGSDIASLQARLRTTPGDFRTWSALAVAYVEQARVTGDPSFYAKAEEAVAEATRLRPGDPEALVAEATLRAARHDFAAALEAADGAIAANAFSAEAHAIRSDALTELGRYDEARRAARRADDLRPGPSTFARLSYAAELRGDLPEAERLMRLSRDASTAPAGFAFAAFHLGELARIGGDLERAATHYAAALEADPSYAPARVGEARLAVAAGDTEAALRGYGAVVRRLPLPEYVVELGELHLALGDTEQARRQFAVAEASVRLAEANGVTSDLETALFEADHGSAAAALAAARAEWAVHPSVFAADALAWALHKSGRDAEALRFARTATGLGTRDARMLFHRGAIEAALGRDAAARAHLQQSLDIDAGVAPWREAQVRELLDEVAA